MTRIPRFFYLLVLLVSINAVSQNSNSPTLTEPSTLEDYAIYSAALKGFFGSQKPERVLLRDHTTASVSANPLTKMYSRDVPKEVVVSFESRNSTQARIEERHIRSQFKIKSLGKREELALISSGGECEQKTPVTFVSRPGVNPEHNLALISVGTSCYDHEENTVLLMKRGGDEWRVIRLLFEDSVIFDRFLPSPAPIAVKIANVEQIDSGSQSLVRVSLVLPNVPNETFDTIRVYGMRIVGTQRSDDRNYPTMHGSWKANTPVEVLVEMPKEFTDAAKGWNLTLCVGTSARCYPSSSLLQCFR